MIAGCPHCQEDAYCERLKNPCNPTTKGCVLEGRVRSPESPAGGPEKTRLTPLAVEKSGFQPDDPVCFCFGHTQKAIEEDFLEHGTSTILAKIEAEKNRGGCDCANQNPRGR